MKIVYFGSYDPNYARNRVLTNGLKKSGVGLIECRVRPGSLISLARLIPKHFKIRKDYDLMIVGFPGQESMFLASFLSRKPIIFDAFTSHYGGYVIDRGYVKKNSFKAKYYRFLDKWSCKLADLVLLDTQAHIDFFVDEFNLPQSKFKRVFVGTDSKLFFPISGKKERDNFSVHFHGHFIPLHGVEFIIKAAKILEDQGINFTIIGKGQTYEKDIGLAKNLNLKNITFINNVAYNELNQYINSADLCLGIFGLSPKANLVIPNKIFEAAACGKPVITMNSKAIGELFTDKKDILLSNAGDPIDLAEKILFLKNNPKTAEEIGKNIRNLFLEHAAEDVIGQDLVNYINEKFSLSK